MKRLLCALPLLLLVLASAAPERFAFHYTKGDKFRILSETDENVYINKRLSHSAKILNRIAFGVEDAAPDSSWGLLSGTFETSEQSTGSRAYVISEQYDSRFRRDQFGHYTIDDTYYMPVVRDVPVFPDRDLSPGDTWTAPGEERHDLRRYFGIPDPYAIPFVAHYTYVGPVKLDGKDLRLITVNYEIFTRPGPPRAYTSIFPAEIAGFSNQKIYWDPAMGQSVAYEESFDLLFNWSDGTRIEYRGTAHAKMLEATLMDRDKLQAEVQKSVEGLSNVSVRKNEAGVTISIENIQFAPDSAVLLPAELDKLAKIAEILKRYPDRDILVAGHTAKAGYAEGRQKLSQERARAVADRLIALGVRTPEHISAIGYGDTQPIADDSTEAGRERNRRVEITILEN